ncbi:MAG TPA: choice-of-anchor D domain-containing protein, partial [Rubricoccaceae bacterium]
MIDPTGTPSLHDLDWRDGALWATDTNPDRLVRIDPATGDLTAPVALSFDPRGLAYDGTANRVSTGFDTSSPLIYTVNAAGTITGQTPAPSALTNGLTFFGGRLFAARAYPDDQAAIVGLDPATGAVVETIPFPAAQPTGIAFLNDGTLWASNAGDDTASNGVYRLYHIDRATGAVLGTLDAPPGTTRTRGLAYDGARYLYVVVQSATFTSVIYKVDLQTTGNAVLGLSTTSVDFGVVVTGQTATRTVTLSNTGDAPLQITDVSVPQAPENGTFSTTLTPTTVPVGGQLQVQVSYTAIYGDIPGGRAQGVLSFATNDVNRPSVSVALSGFPAQPDPTALTVGGASHDFGPVRVDAGAGLTVAVWPLRIQNVGAQPLVLSSATPSTAAFGLYDASDLPLTLAPTEFAEVRFFFRPTTVGPQAGTVAVASNDPASPLTVAFQGTGTADSLAAGSPVWTHAVPDNPSSSGSAKVSSVRVAGDLTGDGLPDLVYAAANSLTVALDADSEYQAPGTSAPGGPAVLWQFNTCPDNNDCGAVSGVDGLYDTGLDAAGDLDGDGTGDVVIGTGGGNDSVVAISGRTGAAIWSVGSASDPYLAPYYSVDVFGPYVATGTGSASAQSPNPVNHRRVYLLDAATGAEIWQRPTGLPNFRTVVYPAGSVLRVATGGGEGSVNRLATYDVADGTPRWSISPSFTPFVIEP